MIAQLLYSFPLDHKTEQGQYFWSGPKRAPQVVNYDPEDPTCLNFVVSAANIFAYALGLDYCRDVELIKALSKKVEMPKFQLKKITIKEDNNDKNHPPEEKSEEDEDAVIRLTEKLKSILKFIFF